jgi:hypothetical protein
MARSSAGSSGRAGVAMQVRISCSQNCMRAGVGLALQRVAAGGLAGFEREVAATQRADRDLAAAVQVEQHQARRRVPLARQRQQEHLQRRLADAGRADDQRVARQLLVGGVLALGAAVQVQVEGLARGRAQQGQRLAPGVAVALAAREVVAAGQRREGARRQLGIPRAPLPVARHLREPGGIGHQVDRGHLQAGGLADGADGLRRAAAGVGHVLAEDHQAVVVLAHAELAVAEFVQRHVHLGDLAGDHVVAGDQLVALQFERAHGLAARQDREALRLDELAGLVEQRVQDAGLDGVGVLLDVHQRGIAPLFAVAQFELVAAEGQARVGSVRYSGPAVIGTGRQQPLTR